MDAEHRRVRGADRMRHHRAARRVDDHAGLERRLAGGAQIGAFRLGHEARGGRGERRRAQSAGGGNRLGKALAVEVHRLDQAKLPRRARVASGQRGERGGRARPVGGAAHPRGEEISVKEGRAGIASRRGHGQQPPRLAEVAPHDIARDPPVGQLAR
jgi:hypothetical protein